MSCREASCQHKESYVPGLASSIASLADSLRIRRYIDYKNSAMGPGNLKKNTLQIILSLITSKILFIDVSLKSSSLRGLEFMNS